MIQGTNDSSLTQEGTGRDYLVIPKNTERYSKEELTEFELLINAKIHGANEIITGYQTYLKETQPEVSIFGTYPKEHSEGMMAGLLRVASENEILRQQRFIGNLRGGLARIQNGTYGICRITGKLIDKARLRAVPHATLSKEAKDARDNGQFNDPNSHLN